MQLHTCTHSDFSCLNTGVFLKPRNVTVPAISDAPPPPPPQTHTQYVNQVNKKIQGTFDRENVVGLEKGRR